MRGTDALQITCTSLKANWKPVFYVFPLFIGKWSRSPQNLQVKFLSVHLPMPSLCAMKLEKCHLQILQKTDVLTRDHQFQKIINKLAWCLNRTVKHCTFPSNINTNKHVRNESILFLQATYLTLLVRGLSIHWNSKFIFTVSEQKAYFKGQIRINISSVSNLI